MKTYVHASGHISTNPYCFSDWLVFQSTWVLCASLRSSVTQQDTYSICHAFNSCHWKYLCNTFIWSLNFYYCKCILINGGSVWLHKATRRNWNSSRQCIADRIQHSACYIYENNCSFTETFLPTPNSKKIKTWEMNKFDFKVNAAEIISFQSILFLTCDFIIIIFKALWEFSGT